METVLRVVDAGCACAREAAGKDTLIFASMGPILYDEPVSYTHLDVYKRQC